MQFQIAGLINLKDSKLTEEQRDINQYKNSCIMV